MLWTTAVILIILWMLGLVAGYTTDLFIYGIYATAVVLLLVSIIREVSTYRNADEMGGRRTLRKASSKNIGSVG